MIFNINKNMKESSYKTEVYFNKDNYIESRIEFGKLNIILTYIIIIIVILIILDIIRREKKLFPLFGDLPRKDTTRCKNETFEVKNEKSLTSIKKELIIKKFNNSKKKEIQIKKSLINIKDKNAIYRYHIIFIIIKALILNIYCLIKCARFQFFYFQNLSKISLKINLIGDSKILGNSFSNFNYLKEVHINGNIIDTKSKKYYFNQTDNYVDSIWNDNINNCANMFDGCSNITEINLSNFNTSQVTTMYNMFNSCSSLTSINVSNLDTSHVNSMGCIFRASSLTHLDLSSFDTSKVESMHYMFMNCFSLISLNLSSFNTSLVKLFGTMFYNCRKLEYINMKNFEENDKITEYNNMFGNVPENVVICINESITKEKIFPQIKAKKCHVIDCTEDWESKQKKIVNDNAACIESCNNSSPYQFEYNGKCYENCINGYLDNDNNIINKCKCDIDKCLLCKNAVTNKKCTKCDTNYYPIENDELNLGGVINCFKEPEGYYLDNNLYKKCYYTCKTCNIEGNDINHNCIKCNNDFPFGISKNNNFNCYQNCEYNYYFDNEINYYCTKNSSCPDEYPKLLEDKKECIRNDIKNIIKNLVVIEKNETVKMTKEEEVEYYENVIEIIEKGFTDNYDTTNMDKGEDEVIDTQKMTITFTTTQNQKSNINKNMSTIDLGECETLIRNYYNISINETLYMKKIDIVLEGMKTKKVQYDVYCKLFGDNLIKLNLTVCEKSKVSIYIPIKVTEEQSSLQGSELQTFIDKLNSSSGYYNDICYTTTSEYGTDISLNTRKIKYKDGNMIVCQEDCDFTKFDAQTFKAECSCKVKQTSSSIADMHINKDKLFNKKGFIKNIGCYLISSIILVHILIIIFFRLKQFYLIKIKIKDITFGINEY